MKWYRNLSFYKRWIEVENDFYKIVNDASITAFVLEKANYYGLRIVELSLSDYSCCFIKLFGDKQSFLCFIRDFIDTYKNHIKNVSF